MRFLVTFKSYQKVVAVESISDLANAIQLAFLTCPDELPLNYHLQYYCNEFQEFIDVDDNSLEDANKIRVVEDEAAGEIANEGSVVESDDSDDSGNEEDTGDEQNQENAPGDEKDKAFDGETVDQDESFVPIRSSSFHNDASSTESSNQSTMFLHWPNPFLLKNDCLRKELLSKVVKKEKLKTGDFTQIFRAIFDECTKYT